MSRRRAARRPCVAAWSGATTFVREVRRPPGAPVVMLLPRADGGRRPQLVHASSTPRRRRFRVLSVEHRGSRAGRRPLRGAGAGWTTWPTTWSTSPTRWASTGSCRRLLDGRGGGPAACGAGTPTGWRDWCWPPPRRSSRRRPGSGWSRLLPAARPWPGRARRCRPLRGGACGAGSPARAASTAWADAELARHRPASCWPGPRPWAGSRPGLDRRGRRADGGGGHHARRAGADRPPTALAAPSPAPSRRPVDGDHGACATGRLAPPVSVPTGDVCRRLTRNVRDAASTTAAGGRAVVAAASTSAVRTARLGRRVVRSIGPDTARAATRRRPTGAGAHRRHAPLPLLDALGPAPAAASARQDLAGRAHVEGQATCPRARSCAGRGATPARARTAGGRPART